MCKEISSGSFKIPTTIHFFIFKGFQIIVFKFYK